jgi:hypothetical protein
VPQLADSYYSNDGAILAQHIKWLDELHIDAITAEQTNGGPCDRNFSDEATCTKFMTRLNGNANGQARYSDSITSINDATMMLYREFADNGTDIKLIPLLDGQDVEMYMPLTSTTESAFDKQIQLYIENMHKFPQLNVIYQSRPLVMVYMGSAQNPANPRSAFSLARKAVLKYKNTLTIRLMAGMIDSQPSLWSSAPGIAGLHAVKPEYQLWSWLDRLNQAAGLMPSYTVSGSRVEAFTVSTATPGTKVANRDGGWNAGDASLYDGGRTFEQFLSYAEKLDPIFLFIDQFNEYGAPDQGVDEQHSNDIEPTKQWQFDRFNTVKKMLSDYRSRVGRL